MLKRLSLACIVAASTFAGATLLDAQQPAPPAGAPPAPAAGQRGGGRGAPPVKSPEVAADGRVTFRLRAPNAKEVIVTFAGTKLPMQGRTGRLERRRPIRSRRTTTPTHWSSTARRSTIRRTARCRPAFGSFQSMFVVPGAQPWLPAPDVPRGAIARHAFRSTVANDDREFFVYTPPGLRREAVEALSGALPAARAGRRRRDGG